MEIRWPIKNQNAKYKFDENPSKESSINISKEIFDFLGGKQTGDIITVKLRKEDFLFAFTKLIECLPLFYYRNGTQKADFSSDFFEGNYKEISEHFGENEIIDYRIKLTINDVSTVRYYIYRIDGAKNLILRDFLIGENSVLIFTKEEDGNIYIRPEIELKQDNDDITLFDEEDDMKETKPFENFEYKVFDNNEEKRYNRIIFGAPGTGKSHEIDGDKDKLKDLDVFERVTFHPNYTYSQFVGTYKPVSVGKGDIEYKYVEGPFMRLLTAALENAKDSNRVNPKRYLLIIEEINRANVAAVFGDMFQLLDRKDGVSEYEIQTSEDVRKYLATKLGGDETEKKYKTLKLPNNFYIWATMNSADQGVQPMDAAFKRRWNFEYLNIDTGAFNFDIPVPKSNTENVNIDWNTLRNEINNTLKTISGVNEDKLLGPFFLGNEEKLKEFIAKPEDFIDLFKSKVLMYLYEDVVKMQPSALFNVKEGSNIHYSDICKDFDSKGLKIFVKSIYNKFEAFKDGDSE